MSSVKRYVVLEDSTWNVLHSGEDESAAIKVGIDSSKGERGSTIREYYLDPNDRCVCISDRFYKNGRREYLPNDCSGETPSGRETDTVSIDNFDLGILTELLSRLESH